jgi:hypothetical protein
MQLQTFDVPVDDAVLMQVVDGQTQLAGVAANEVFRQTHLGRFFYRPSVAVLHEHQHLILSKKEEKKTTNK